MITSRFALGLTVLGALWASAAGAQTPATSSSSAASDSTLRLATNTADGDTGLWYVPTAEILARGKWSAAGYRTGFNYREGFSQVTNVPLTFGIGVSKRAEIFGSFRAVTRIDRDTRPLFQSDPLIGGVVGPYPFVKQGWSGSQVGDFLVGAKINLLSEADNKPAALAVRGMVKLPTGSKEYGVSTGKADGIVDVIVSKDAGKKVELTGYAGAIVRGQPDGASQSNALRYGVGAGFPTGRSLRVTAEYFGEKPFDKTTISTPLVAFDGSIAPTSTPLDTFNALTFGLTWQHHSGFFAGAAATWSGPTADRSKYRVDEQQSGDWLDYQFRIG